MKKITALIISLLMAALCAACTPKEQLTVNAVSYTHLRAHET